MSCNVLIIAESTASQLIQPYNIVWRLITIVKKHLPASEECKSDFVVGCGCCMLIQFPLFCFADDELGKYKLKYFKYLNIFHKSLFKGQPESIPTPSVHYFFNKAIA